MFRVRVSHDEAGLGTANIVAAEESPWGGTGLLADEARRQ